MFLFEKYYKYYKILKFNNFAVYLEMSTKGSPSKQNVKSDISISKILS